MLGEVLYGLIWLAPDAVAWKHSGLVSPLVKNTPLANQSECVNRLPWEDPLSGGNHHRHDKSTRTSAHTACCGGVTPLHSAFTADPGAKAFTVHCKPHGNKWGYGKVRPMSGCMRRVTLSRLAIMSTMQHDIYIRSIYFNPPADWQK